jgi:hypothetical protein
MFISDSYLFVGFPCWQSLGQPLNLPALSHRWSERKIMASVAGESESATKGSWLIITAFYFRFVKWTHLLPSGSLITCRSQASLRPLIAPGLGFEKQATAGGTGHDANDGSLHAH